MTQILSIAIFEPLAVLADAYNPDIFGSCMIKQSKFRKIAMYYDWFQISTKYKLLKFYTHSECNMGEQ